MVCGAGGTIGVVADAFDLGDAAEGEWLAAAKHSVWLESSEWGGVSVLLIATWSECSEWSATQPQLSGTGLACD